MAGHKHATVSLWNREEDGSYVAEVAGYKLHVKWVPEKREGDPHGFSWSGTKGEGEGAETIGEDKLFEEINVAMATAEDHARRLDTRDDDKSVENPAH